MKTRKSLLLSIVILILVLSAGSSLAITATEMSEFLPNKVLNFTSTEPPTIQDLEQTEGKYHRVQKLYNSKSGQLAAVAAICGAGVSAKITSVFSNAKTIDIQGFKAIAATSSQNGSNSVTIYVKLQDDQMITAMLMNTEDAKLAKKFLGSLNLKGLAGVPVAAFGQQGEKYEKVSKSDFKITISIPKGAAFQIKDGVMNGGPIKELSFWGHKIELANNGMVKDGFLHTKDFGKFQFVSNAIDGSFHVDLTPSQQKKLLELNKGK